MPRPAVWLLLLIAALPGAAAEIHRCRGADGQTVYTDRRCPGDTQALDSRPMPKSRPTVAGIAPRCDREQDDWSPVDFRFDAVRASLRDPQRLAADAALVAVSRTRPADAARWQRSRRGDLHFCGKRSDGTPIELVAGLHGELLLFAPEQVRYVNDPDDPLVRLSTCTHAILGCFEPPERGLDGCVERVPTCVGPASHTAPGCCPQQCKQAYRAKRDAGSDPMNAMLQVFHGDHSCVPGLRQKLVP